MGCTLLFETNKQGTSVSAAATIYHKSPRRDAFDERTPKDLTNHLLRLLGGGEPLTAESIITINHCYDLIRSALTALSQCQMSSKWEQRVEAAIIPVFEQMITAIQSVLPTKPPAANAGPIELDDMASLCKLCWKQIWHTEGFRKTCVVDGQVVVNAQLEFLVMMIPIANIVSLYQLAVVLPNNHLNMELLAIAIEHRTGKEEETMPGSSHQLNKELCRVLSMLLDTRGLSMLQIAPVVDAITRRCRDVLPLVETGKYHLSRSVRYLLKLGLPAPLVSSLERPPMSDAQRIESAKTAVPLPSNRFIPALGWGALDGLGSAAQAALHAVPNSEIRAKTSGPTWLSRLGKRRLALCTSPDDADDEAADDEADEDADEAEGEDADDEAEGEDADEDANEAANEAADEDEGRSTKRRKPNTFM